MGSSPTPGTISAARPDVLTRSLRPMTFLRLMRRRALLLLILVSTLGLRCARNGERAAIDEPLVPPGTVEREPYLVTVTDSSAVLRWTTYTPAQPGIRFWTEEGDTTQLVLSQSGRNHTFEMLSLQPATPYSYQIQINDTLWSSVAQIRTFPEPGSKDPFTFIAIGDTGTRNQGQLALAEQLNQEEPAFVIHMGDLAYPDGTPLEYTQNHFAVYAPLLKRAPVFPSPGDHDLRIRLGEVYAEIFTPPGGRDSGSPLYYSFTHGNARFISLSTKEDEEYAQRYGYIGNPASDQYQWLLLQLSAARRDPGIDWIVVYFHHSPYSASAGFAGHGSHLPTRRALAPLMDGYRVPLVFSGHDHDYQRSHPIRGNQIADPGEGTVYMVTGGGGGRWTFRGTGADWFTAFADQRYSYARVTIDHYDLRLEAIGTDGQVFDSWETSIPEDQRKTEVRRAVPLTLDEAPAGAASGDSN